MITNKKLIASAVAAVFTSSLTACVSVGDQARKTQAETDKSIRQSQDQEPVPAPVITSTSGAWLMGL